MTDLEGPLILTVKQTHISHLYLQRLPGLGAGAPGEVDLGLSLEGGGELGRGRGSSCVRRARKRLPPAHPERRGSGTPALQLAGRARAEAGCAGERGAAEPHRFAPAPRLARAAVLDRRESTLRHPLAAEPG